MRFAAMQPYFLPYIGYWQLMHSVDVFVVYDNIEFTKKGWINRNRMLLNGEPSTFTINLRKDSDYLDVRERYISPVYDKVRKKILNQIRMAYLKAPMFDAVMPLVESCFCCEKENLFDFILHSISKVQKYLEIETKLQVSSDIPIDHSLKNKHRLWAIGGYLEMSGYVNSIGGQDLYDKGEFSGHGLNLEFLRSEVAEYRQFENEFVPSLSIMDVLMFNDTDSVKSMLSHYVLI
jgi:hypothetical protein